MLYIYFNVFGCYKVLPHSSDHSDLLVFSLSNAWTAGVHYTQTLYPAQPALEEGCQGLNNSPSTYLSFTK